MLSAASHNSLHTNTAGLREVEECEMEPLSFSSKEWNSFKREAAEFCAAFFFKARYLRVITITNVDKNETCVSRTSVDDQNSTSTLISLGYIMKIPRFACSRQKTQHDGRADDAIASLYHDK